MGWFSMKYFIDSEFIDDGRTIDLISIGIVAEDGRELYLESADVDKGKAGQWVREHVFPHLKGGEYRWPLRSIKVTLLDFFDIEEYGKPELWGYYSAYDHVAFCQLFGTMMDLPQGYPYLTYDLRQWLDMQGLQDVKQPDDAPHHALEDARWIAQTYKRVSTGSGRS
jgi:hypothetical protein